MTTAPAPLTVEHVEALGAAPAPMGLFPLRRTRAWAVIASHFVIDAFSFMVIALLPLLTVTLDIPNQQKALLLGIGSVSSGLVQPAVAWFSDRWNTRLLGTIGFLIGVLAITAIGSAQTFTQLVVLHAVGAMGVGAYHPPAAAAVGRLGGPNRARFVALFFVAGMLGGIAGNVLTPRFVDAVAHAGPGPVDTQRGLDALRWFIPVGVVFAVVLLLAVRRVGRRPGGADDDHRRWDEAERRGRWGAVRTLYLSNILRFSVNMSLVYLLTEWAARHTLGVSGMGVMTEAMGARASEFNGVLQASMQVGMGGGGLLLGFFLPARFEKTAFWLTPMLGSVAVTLIAAADGAAPALAAPLAVSGAVLAGAGFGACVPVSLSLAQRMLPHRASLASGLMLGGAWAFAFVGPLAAEWVQNGLLGGLGLNAAFLATAAALFASGLISLRLPHALMVRTHGDERSARER